MNPTYDFLSGILRGAWAPPFRGEIYDYARKLNLQNGYAVKGPFDIRTARHLIKPLQAIRDPRVRLVSVMAAVQTLKSLIADLTVPYWIEHDPGDILWLFEDDPKARLYAETRAMPLFESIPEIRELLAGIERHDKTKTKIKFRHMNLILCGLNLGNVQSISYRYLILDELWMHQSDGLVRQAKDRTKQYPDTKKILLLGQGGVEDDDADREHQQTQQLVLHYACPKCGHRQPFELTRLRPEDFPDPKLRGTFAGLSWDTNDRTRPDGRWDWDAVGRTAHHRCFACDHRILDTPAIRRALNDSYDFFPVESITQGVIREQTDDRRQPPPSPICHLPSPMSEAMGFHWPAEASTRIPFKDLVVKYLRAKTNAEELGYKLPLAEFYQKDRGLPWAEDREGVFRALAHEPYDANADWPEQAYRTLCVDCQRDLKKFFFSAYAVALHGEARELERGPAESFADLAAVQTKWGIKDQHVFLDCGYEMTKVLRECVTHGHVATIKIGNQLKKVWRCWTGLKGSGRELFAHKHPRSGLTDMRIYSRCNWYNVDVGSGEHHPRAPWYEWSNLHCKDLLRARRDADPGVAKFLTLPDTLPATDPWSYFAQMRSERRREEWTPKGKRAIWELVKQTRPNHYWDVAAELMVFMAIVGIIGAPDTPLTPEEPQKAVLK